MNTYYVKACHLRTCASKATNSQVLIRVLREKQEIEFIQCNGGQSHGGKQTDHFSPISNHVLFMRANLVWTMFHWYSVHLLCADCLGTKAILFYALIYSFIYLFIFLISLFRLKICMAWKAMVTMGSRGQTSSPVAGCLINLSLTSLQSDRKVEKRKTDNERENKRMNWGSVLGEIGGLQ